MSLLLSQLAPAADFPGEEHSPFVATFVATVLVLAPVSEEFGGAHPTEEYPISTIAVLEASPTLASVEEEFVAAPAVAAEETGSLPALVFGALLTAISAPEEFSGSLPLEEVASQQTIVEPVWISWSLGEEFAGSLPLEEPSFAQAHVEPVQIIWSVAPLVEELPSVLSLEELGVLLTFQEPVWIGISFSEELATGFFVEEISPPTSMVTAIVIGSFSAPEEFVGEEVPPPPPPPPPPPSPIRERQIVHVSGTGFNALDCVEAVGEEVVECLTIDDVQCLVDELRARAETEEMKSWTKRKLARERGETPRARVLLREVQEVPSIDPICGSAPLARVALYGAAAVSDGLDVRVAVHSYSGSRIDRVLIAVRADGDWHYADPNGSLPFGHAMPFSSVRFYEPARRREVKVAAAAIDQNLQQMVNAILTESPTETRAIERVKSRRIPGIWLILAGVLIGLAFAPSTPSPRRRKRRRRRR